MVAINYQNADGASVDLSTESAYLLQGVTGFESPKSNLYTAKIPGQDGATMTGSDLDKKERTITGEIIVNSAVDLPGFRRTLEIAFSTKVDGVLNYTENGVSKQSDCRVETVAFAAPTALSQKFDITLLCANPFWHDVAESADEIALWLSSFEIDSADGFEIGAADGMEFGQRAPSVIVDVENPGDVPCGMRVIFCAAATVVNPSIFNVNTREYFQINKTLQGGETVEVNTKFGQKSVTGTLNGQTLNYFNYAGLPGSTFLQLGVGSNPLRYNADSGLANLNVTIRYSPQYLGV